ncbi:sugar isomerase domain-containing protein [Lysinibacter cavernae]|uniref:Putative phosphosugar-binding protein n=1 Tax=Lysinibacter cavernae TaxID=1640652 RepID=A0A7X5TTM6_9MICO|nr:putative phosphosugar-binding protein [Lysinibacter cavernae]
MSNVAVPSDSNAQEALTEFGNEISALVNRVIEGNRETVTKAADRIRHTLDNGGVVYTAGAGHSLAAVMETFFRAGGLAPVRPLWHADVLPFNGAALSTQAERTPGLGRSVIDASTVEARDTVVLFSTSGINPYPLEIALGARERGATVIAVTSVGASQLAPQRAGQRLFEIADVVLDTLVPSGDASWPVGGTSVTAPVSSITNTVLWDCVLVALYEADPSLPVWRSANIATAGSSNDDLMAHYAERIPEMLAADPARRAAVTAATKSQ